MSRPTAEHRRKRSVLRMIDANANRALEGLRVCEEVVRFHLEVPESFKELRALRHALAQEIRRLPVTPAELVEARESGRDIGRSASSASVGSLERILLMNFQRAKEALRTLEECTRLLAPRQTANFQRLRFRIYHVERTLVLLTSRTPAPRMVDRSARPLARVR